MEEVDSSSHNYPPPAPRYLLTTPFTLDMISMLPSRFCRHLSHDQWRRRMTSCRRTKTRSHAVSLWRDHPRRANSSTPFFWFTVARVKPNLFDLVLTELSRRSTDNTSILSRSSGIHFTASDTDSTPPRIAKYIARVALIAWTSLRTSGGHTRTTSGSSVLRACAGPWTDPTQLNFCSRQNAVESRPMPHVSTGNGSTGSRPSAWYSA